MEAIVKRRNHDECTGSNSEEKNAAEKMYGPRALSSQYEFLSAQMYETGAEVGLTQSSLTNLAATMLLMLKPIHKATVVYVLPPGRLRGFQVGDPAVPATPVRLLLFDENDTEFQIWVRGPKSGPGLTQEQLNAIVASLRPAA